MTRYGSSPRKKIVDVRRQRRETKRAAESMSSALRLANPSTSLPGRNECLGIHCSLIVQEEKEDSFCQMCQRV